MTVLRDRMPRWIKRIVWDLKSASLPSVAPSKFVQLLLENITDQATLLDLGCGSGNLLHALRSKGWQGYYLGVDISPRAIAEAQAFSDPRAHWTVSALEDFVPERQYDAICMVESIYYINPNLVESVLQRCIDHLSADGLLYIRICDPKRHAPQVDLIRNMQDPRIRLSATEV